MAEEKAVLCELPKEGRVLWNDIKPFVPFKSRTTLAAKIKNGIFPPPTMIEGGIRSWDVEVVREYISGRYCA